ncbi:MAG: tyrosine-type recombinase/integrase [Desulfobaccales bacterium]
MKRCKTDYPGVFYREAKRTGGKGLEKVFYIVFKKDGKVLEEKVGRQFVDDMTAARASRIRADRIEGKRLSRKEIRTRQEAQKQAEAERWTINRLWQEYTAHSQLKGLAQDRSRFDNYIKPAWGDKEPHEIMPLEIDRLRLRILKDKAPQTLKNTLALMRRLINFGMKRRYCRDLSFHLEMPKVNNLKTEDLSPEQLAKLMAAIDADHDIQAANLMKLALFTGMRKGEMFRLKWDDVDSDRGFIHLRDPKGGKDQTIPLNQAARALLANHPRGDSAFVFPGRGGKQRTEIRRPIDRIRKTAGLSPDFRPLHGLRHVYASMLASSGQVDLYTLQKLLTHKSAAMTQRYAHLRDDTLRRASDLAGDLITKAVVNGNNHLKVVED